MPSSFMERNQGMIPALMYMVTVTKRYQSLRLHMVSRVNM